MRHIRRKGRSVIHSSLSAYPVFKNHCLPQSIPMRQLVFMFMIQTHARILLSALRSHADKNSDRLGDADGQITDKKADKLSINDG